MINVDANVKIWLIRVLLKNVMFGILVHIERMINRRKLVSI